MKNFYILLSLLLLLLLSSCIIEKDNICCCSSSIETNDAYYISRMVWPEDDVCTAYVQYPQGVDTVFSTIEASDIVFDIGFMQPYISWICNEKQTADTWITQYQAGYVVRFTEFDILVPFVIEKPYVLRESMAYEMPWIEPKFFLENLTITDLPDEKIGEKEYYCSMVSCTVKACAGDQTIWSTAHQKIMEEKIPIIFNPAIDGWEDVVVNKTPPA